MSDETHNPNCDGEHCTRPDGEMRRYPIGRSSGAMLCRDCFEVANGYRAEARLRDRRPEDWPHVDWETAERYPDATGI